MDIELSPVQRKALKARAHPLHPVVIVGDKGLTEPVLHEIEVNLKSHELIKVRVASADRDERETMLQAMCGRLGAHPVQHIGRILVIYRAKPPEPPPARRKAPPQRARTIAKATSAQRPARTRGRPAERPSRPKAGLPRATDAKPTRRRSSSGSALAETQARRPASSGRALATRQARRPARTR